MTALKLPGGAFADVARHLTRFVKRPDGQDVTAFNAAADAQVAMRQAILDLDERVSALEGDETAPPPAPEPIPEPEPPQLPNVAPRTYNLGTNDSDPRFCTTGLRRNAAGHLVDDFSEYDDDGRSLGGRDRNRMVPGLKVANEMDQRGPCDPYTKDGRAFPPWPAESYLR